MDELRYGPRAWRADEIDAYPAFPERGFGPAWVGDDELAAGDTLYTILGAERATVAYNGRSKTWRCGSPNCLGGAAPCRHVAGAAWWTELPVLRQRFLALTTWDLIERWGREVARVRAIRGALGPEPRHWRLQAAALFAALVEHGLAQGTGEDCDPVFELVEQLEAVAA